MSGVEARGYDGGAFWLGVVSRGVIAGYVNRQKSTGWAADNKFADYSVWGHALFAPILDG
jgi:hypothetical protein